MKIKEFTTIIDVNTGLPKLENSGSFEFVYDIEKWNGPEHIYNFCIKALRMEIRTEEYVYLLCFDNACGCIGFFEISHGTINQALIGIREIACKSLLLGACKIAVVHNHPSGLLKPSQADFNITKKIREMADFIGIQFVDHLIISKSGYLSLVENDFKNGHLQ